MDTRSMSEQDILMVKELLKETIKKAKKRINGLPPETQDSSEDLPRNLLRIIGNRELIRQTVRNTIDEATSDVGLLIAALTLLFLEYNDPFVDLFIDKMFAFDMDDLSKG